MFRKALTPACAVAGDPDREFSLPEQRVRLPCHAPWPGFRRCDAGQRRRPLMQRPLWVLKMAHAPQELDPGGKFSSLSSVWAWRATRQGLDVPLALCCTPGGFSANCTCAPRLDCSA